MHLHPICSVQMEWWYGVVVKMTTLISIQRDCIYLPSVCRYWGAVTLYSTNSTRTEPALWMFWRSTFHSYFLYWKRSPHMVNKRKPIWVRHAIKSAPGTRESKIASRCVASHRLTDFLLHVCREYLRLVVLKGDWEPRSSSLGDHAGSLVGS